MSDLNRKGKDVRLRRVRCCLILNEFSALFHSVIASRSRHEKRDQKGQLWLLKGVGQGEQDAREDTEVLEKPK